MSRHRAALAAAAAAILAGASSAAAVPRSTPDAGWPHTDGAVRAIAVAGNRLYIAGEFTQVGGQTHKGVAALNATTGAVDPGFTASADGDVLAIAISGSTLYLGGQFQKVDGVARPRLGAVDPTNGSLKAGFDPNVGTGAIRALALSSTRLYAGGESINVGGSPPLPNPRQLWSFDPTSGAVDAGFDAEPEKAVRVLLLSGTLLYAGGDFTTIGVTPRRGVAALDPATGAPDAGFNANANSDVYSLASAGPRLYLGGAFSQVGGAQRVGLAAVSLATGAVDHGWVADADHLIYALATSDSRLYAGGPKGSFGALGSQTVVAARLSDGHLSTDFKPDFGSGPPQVFALAASSARLYAGGSFTMPLPGGQQGIAAFRFLPPASASSPFLRGNPVKGRRLTCRPGTWRNDPTTFAFRWLRDGKAISGATATSYKVAKTDVGHHVRCRVTATNPAGHGTATSAAVIPALPDTTPPKMKILSGSLTMNGRGDLKVRLGCPRSETRCTGTVVLQALGVKGKPLLGVKGFSIRGGRSRGVKVHLDKSAQSLVRQRGSLRARVRVNARDAAGNAARITRKLTIVVA